jgi:hypothetical protein
MWTFIQVIVRRINMMIHSGTPQEVESVVSASIIPSSTSVFFNLLTKSYYPTAPMSREEEQ